MTGGALIIGFTVLSAFTATRIYLAEQFPTELRGRGHTFGESFGRLVWWRRRTPPRFLA